MSRAKPLNRSQLSGECSKLDESQKKLLREKLATSGLCSCHQPDTDDCSSSCLVRRYVNGINGIVFHAGAQASFANPLQMAASLEKVTKSIDDILDTLTAKGDVSLHGGVAGREYVSDNLSLLDEQTLRYFQPDIDDLTLAALESSPFLGLLLELKSSAKERIATLQTPREERSRRHVQQNLVNMLAESWFEIFDEDPSTLPNGPFAGVIRQVSDRWKSDSALQSAITRARKFLRSTK